jgi:hypothetical protein
MDSYCKIVHTFEVSSINHKFFFSSDNKTLLLIKNNESIQIYDLTTMKLIDTITIK